MTLNQWDFQHRQPLNHLDKSYIKVTIKNHITTTAYNKTVKQSYSSLWTKQKMPSNYFIHTKETIPRHSIQTFTLKWRILPITFHESLISIIYPVVFYDFLLFFMIYPIIFHIPIFLQFVLLFLWFILLPLILW